MNEELRELFGKALLAYIEVLELHIDSKTTDFNFHQITELIYEELFEIAHSIAERYIDLGGSLRSDHGDCKSQGSRLVDILTTLKSDIESVQGSRGTQAMLDEELDELEFLIGNAKSFDKNKSRNKSGIELGGDENNSKEIEVEIKTTPINKSDTMSDEVEDMISL